MLTLQLGVLIDPHCFPGALSRESSASSPAALRTRLVRKRRAGARKGTNLRYPRLGGPASLR